ncbi:MAG: hypothetical protein JWQ19_428 [Subtercola sp.]|nr:hypothetical protein [Subtercola sp.]
MSDEPAEGPGAGADEAIEVDAAAGEAALAQAEGPAPFRIVFDQGVTVTKWTRVWEQRLPGIPLQVTRSEPGQQTSALLDGVADVSFVRHPFDRTGFSAIELYSEQPVVGVAKDHPVSAFDHVDVADLAAEHLLQEPKEFPEWSAVADELADGSRRPLLGIHSLDDAVEQVAAGVGIVILPQSIARLHNRKDVVYRPVTGVAETPVSLVWAAGDPSPLVEQFIGIVRGRSASSSRGGGSAGAAGAAGAQAPSASGAVDARGHPNASAAVAASAAAAVAALTGAAAKPPKKIGPVAKAKAKARAAREAEEAASGRPKQNAPRKKTQSEQANKAHARKRKFGGKR